MRAHAADDHDGQLVGVGAFEGGYALALVDDDDLCHAVQLAVGHLDVDGAVVVAQEEEHFLDNVRDGVHLFRNGLADTELAYLRHHVVEVELARGDVELECADALYVGSDDGVLRLLEYAVGGAVLDEGATVEEEDALRKVACEAHFVGDKNHGEPLFGQQAHDAGDFGHHGGVQCRSGLVEEQNLGLQGQCACYGGALLLSAGEGGGEGRGFLGKADLVEGVEGAGPGFVFGEVLHLGEGQGDVAHEGEVGEKVALLEDVAHLLPQAVDGIAGGGDLLSVDDDGARRGRVEEVEGAQEGGFAGARRAYDADKLALVDAERNVVQRLEGGAIGRGVGLVDVAGGNHGLQAGS